MIHPAPKPAPRPKKQPRQPQRSTRPKRVNAKRKQSEFERCYHSRERVLFVKNFGCVYCTALSPFFGVQTLGKCHNAHTANEGRGRKGHYTTIIPLCPEHHRRFDEYRFPFDTEDSRNQLKACAPEIQRLWNLVADGGGA